MIERENIAWEKQYEKLNLTEKEKNRACERNSYIFEYIKNNLGFRLGVVVAQKRGNDTIPYIGWSLFSEISKIPNVVVDSFYDIPEFQRFLNTHGIANLYKEETYSRLLPSLMEFRLTDFDLDIRTFPTAFHIPSKHYRDYLINLALARAIPYTEENRHNYYCPYISDDSLVEEKADSLIAGSISFGTQKNHRTDLINEKIIFKKEHYIEAFAKNFENLAFDASTSKYIRQTIRHIEYRAWKHFGENF